MLEGIDFSDMRWALVGGLMWLLIVILIWKFSIGGTVDTTKLKIGATVIMLPISLGLCYLMRTK